MVDKITDHKTEGLNRLASQYKDKQTVRDLVGALINGHQELEDATHAMFLNRFVDNAEGIQLDRFGEIVGREREGFDDTFYRILLKVQIGINTSNGTHEDIASILKLLTGGNLVHVQNLGNAQVGMWTDAEIDASLVNLIYDSMEEVVADGVRVNFIACMDPDEAFSFDGIGPIGLGFSAIASPTTGGKFAFIHRRSIPFAFAGADTSALGFGTLADPLAGGSFVGL